MRTMIEELPHYTVQGTGESCAGTLYETPIYRADGTVFTIEYHCDTCKATIQADEVLERLAEAGAESAIADYEWQTAFTDY
jgi:hypothetical protein